MLNADRVSAGDSLKLIVSGSQIHKKQTIVKQNKVDRAGCRTISLLQWNYRKITVNRKICGEIPGSSIARYPVNICNHVCHFTAYVFI